mgnify:CR=1 FL=1
MSMNVSDSFITLPNRENNAANEYIDGMSVRLLGYGMYHMSDMEVMDFILPMFLVVYYKQGSVEVTHGNRRILLKPGSFYIFRPYEVYSGKRVGNTQPVFAFIQFDITPFMARFNFDIAVGSISNYTDTKYNYLGALLKDLAESDPSRHGREATARQFIKYLTARIIYDQIENTRDKELFKIGRESRLINLAFTYVAEHMAEPIVITDIIHYTATSKTSLDKAFRKILNKTPRQALTQFKIERSMEMLLQGVPIKTISKNLGFCSAYHYSNTFKSVVGIRPTEYRDAGI